MLNYEISKKREELNKSIEEGQDYSVTYRISVELDELIAQYYRNLNDESKSNKNCTIESKIFAKN